ncbi:transcriptional regulator [Nonomuraea deserti]|uniref:Transcriptional regulator n=1 Tax=Nonomuraea deserti TaxID=1848322 RepID=A0A4R4VYW7_9ACTN|nr:transcriptional regulator [Nonomuraea deserti]
MGGRDEEHVARLAEIDVELPPILVDRRTMEVVDGAHRFMAAVLNGKESINVEFLDGTAEDAFLCAVEANVKHGLPLSRADRRAAAARIITSHPEMSDRAIAEVVGMAAKIVAEMRHMAQDVSSLPSARVGRDGRTRPLSTVEGRLKAAKMLEDQPRSSLREVAKISGISPNTVADVRRRLARGEDPIPEPYACDESRPDSRVSSARRRSESRPLRASLSTAVDPVSIVTKLACDPSMRHKQAGRQLLRVLQANASSLLESASLASAVPSHSVPILVQLARRYAQLWDEFAQELEGSARLMPESKARGASGL